MWIRLIKYMLSHLIFNKESLVLTCSDIDTLVSLFLIIDIIVFAFTTFLNIKHIAQESFVYKRFLMFGIVIMFMIDLFFYTSIMILVLNIPVITIILFVILMIVKGIICEERDTSSTFGLSHGILKYTNNLDGRFKMYQHHLNNYKILKSESI